MSKNKGYISNHRTTANVRLSKQDWKDMRIQYIVSYNTNYNVHPVISQACDLPGYYCELKMCYEGLRNAGCMLTPFRMECIPVSHSYPFQLQHLPRMFFPRIEMRKGEIHLFYIPNI